MYRKLFLLVLVVVAVQSFVHDDEEDVSTLFNNNGEIDLQKLKRLIIQAARQAWQKLHNDLNAKVRKGIVQNELKVTEDTRVLLEQIAKLAKEAEKRKVDIKICLKGEEELKTAPRELRRKLYACDRELLAKTMAASTDRLKTVAEAFRDLKKLGAELKACRKGGESEKCLTNVEAEIAQADREIPAKIEKTVDAIVPVIQKLMPVAEKCITNEYNAVFANERSIAKEIETCINSKLQKH